ncbi:nucleotidyltransferase domain-containing protein [candidate division KSB1 bacterium]|nr:nucleotidyltransferase domain-containing protein [candidate division KSB1 bacterium]
MTIPDILKSCKTTLENSYQSQFKGLILYGSMARDQAHSDSDIDLLVLLNHPVNYFRELRSIIELLYPIQLESDQLISAKPVAWDNYEAGALPLYRNAKREGILV